MTMFGRRSLRPIVAAAGLVFLLSVLGALATDIGPWDFALRRAGWQPPNGLFWPAWTLLFCLGGLAGVGSWRACRARVERIRILALIALNSDLETLWSHLFSRLQRSGWALSEWTFLRASNFVLRVLLWPLSHAATGLIGVYLAWVSFLSVLNLAIVRLNAPFAV